jgi:hypothetical protein
MATVRLSGTMLKCTVSLTFKSLSNALSRTRNGIVMADMFTPCQSPCMISTRCASRSSLRITPSALADYAEAVAVAVPSTRAKTLSVVFKKWVMEFPWKSTFLVSAKKNRPQRAGFSLM